MHEAPAKRCHGSGEPAPETTETVDAERWHEQRTVITDDRATLDRAEAPMTQPFRIETDSLGGIEVASEALWGAQTQRSLQNFAISDERIPLEIIQALAWIKRSCATVNGQHALLSPQQVELICTAADAIAAGQHNDQFPLRVWQTGSGTQTNMNINEVISNLASQASGTALGSHRPVHPE